jgi:uncharacterized protein (DUF1501 family)
MIDSDWRLLWPVDSAVWQRLHDLYVISLYGQPEDVANDLVLTIGPSLAEFQGAIRHGMVHVLGDFNDDGLWYVVFVGSGPRSWKPIVRAHSSQLFPPR